MACVIPILILGNHQCPHLPQYAVQMTWLPSSLWLIQGSALSMLKCFGTFIFTRDVEFLPKESSAISIQDTSQGPHLKAIYLSQRNLVLLRLNLSRQSDPIIKTTLTKLDCFQSNILLHRPKLFAYGFFSALSELSLCPMFHAWKHTWCFLSVTGKTIQSRKALPTRHFTLGVVFSYASCCAISLVIQAKLTPGRIFNLFITFW